MSDTPRVTVPVEQLENWRNDLSLHGVGDIETAVEIDAILSAPEGGAVDEVTEADAPAHLSAEAAYGWACGYNAALATREEAPAEMFGVTGAADETEALAVALFAVRCPGVRMTDEDLHHYRSAAQRAMQVVSAELSGNPGQLEAPAEAGERDVIAREVWIGFTGNQNAWDRAKDTDNETAKYCWATADRILALRAQPQARPTASDIAKFADANMTPEAKIKSDIGQPPAREDAVREKGRELVKALKRYGFPVSGAAAVNLGAFGSSEAMAVDFTTREFIQALAALQAEQKGGAPVKLSDLILAVGDDAVRFQNLDQCASDLSYSAKHGTKIVFGTDQPLDFNGTKDLGLVVWLPRDAVAKALSAAPGEAGE